MSTNVLTKFHEEVITRFYYSHIWINSQTPGSRVFQQTGNIFELIQDIIKPNFEKCSAPLRPCVQPTETIFKFLQDIIGTDLLTKFHYDQTINTNLLTEFHEDKTINVAIRALTRKTTPPHSGHVFNQTRIIFELIQDVIKTYVLTKYIEDRTINLASMPSKGKCHAQWRPGFLTNRNCFRIVQDISRTNLLTKFHEDRTMNVASTVLKIFYYSHLYKNAPPPVFQANKNIFKFVQDIIKANLLTKFYEGRTINVASRLLTRQMLTPYDTRRTTHDA
ncbi:hypothetical protein DPMN_138682 [Dreissena polymorpha]|uniref:Uncharacterized protein n=1 Tax=Dreissena polymorpha TaxID=45954 RepID=A0A9D4JK27_DREPO|nr:hypothetical protein DPMN_138682 [Dreissena polymorpha]